MRFKHVKRWYNARRDKTIYSRGFEKVAADIPVTHLILCRGMSARLNLKN